MDRQVLSFPLSIGVFELVIALVVVVSSSGSSGSSSGSSGISK